MSNNEKEKSIQLYQIKLNFIIKLNFLLDKSNVFFSNYSLLFKKIPIWE